MDEARFESILSLTLGELTRRYPPLEVCGDTVRKAIETIIRSYEAGGKVLICGNGGSASDAEHIAGELMKGFLSKRKLREEAKERFIKADPELGKVLAEKLQTPLEAIALTGQVSLSTAFANDVDPALVYAQQVFGYGKQGDVLVAISTSGNAGNVLYAAVAARTLGLSVVSLTGQGGGKLAAYADCAVRVPETETFKVQELHLPAYHAICQAVEEYFFADLSEKR